MAALLFLGLIPGTNIQIDFAHWLLLMGALFAIAALYPFRKKPLGLYILIVLAIRFSTYSTRLIPQA